MENNRDSNTNEELPPDKTAEIEAESTSSWKNNLSKRWSKKQPTKAELCDTFLDLKNTMVVQSNNIIGLNMRIQGLERDMADLIRNINERL